MNSTLSAAFWHTFARRALILAMLCGLLVSWSVGYSPAIAQEPAEEEVKEEPAAAPPPEAEAPAASATPAAGSDTAESPEKLSYLKWTFKSLGWTYSIAFLALSFTLVALFVMNLLQARRENVLPTDLIQTFEAHLEAKQYQEAYELASNDDSFLGKVLSAGLSKISSGYEQAIEAMQEVGEDESMKIEHRLSYMALIGTISPMIGLLGTVQGMIASFNVIAFAETAPKPSQLAEGIATALFTTLVGLLIAIPAIAAYNILRNRASRLTLEVGIVSEGLMSRFQSTAKKQA